MTDTPEQPADAPVLTALLAATNAERRTPLTPESVKLLVEHGWQCVMPSGLGERAGYTDASFEDAGARVVGTAAEAVSDARAVLCVEPPPADVFHLLAASTLVVGLLSPFNQGQLFEKAATANISSIAMELVPRSTIAQPMDALSSQASLAGYAAVLRAADRLPRVLPMMSTPAGTIPPARVLVIGTGVAGLQAIATAVRLGARVSAYDVRAVAKEQVESLGARFVKIEDADVAETSDGYAGAQSEAELAAQRKALADVCAQSDVIITTAQIFGRPAPMIVDRDIIAGMKPGSVIVDAAISTGGNVEGAIAGEDVVIENTVVIADAHLPSSVATESSRMLSSNIVSLLRHVMPDGPSSELTPDANEILSSVLVTHQGSIRHTAATTAPGAPTA
ncbi:MAG: NAD(P) transhydrogenase subunit alpha [Planctomycetota bacterium]